MQVKMVRVYLSEDSPHLNPTFDYLHQQRVKGATMFRGVKGFGHTGKLRETTMLDMHFSLPVIIEFFDDPAKVNEILNHLGMTIEQDRIVHWIAQMGAG